MKQIKHAILKLLVQNEFLPSYRYKSLSFFHQMNNNSPHYKLKTRETLLKLIKTK